jgi:predicted ATP-binding protein involved in virulence
LLRVWVKGNLQSRDINALSSGERQIVVILTHLAFNRQAKQELFVDAVASASPGLQVILATHSPSIIKGRNDRCIDVREEWQNAGLFA